MLAILRAKEKWLLKQLKDCSDGQAISLQKGGEVVEEGCGKAAAPTAMSIGLKKVDEVMVESCEKNSAPIAPLVAPVGGVLETDTRGTEGVVSECKDEHCIINVCGVAHQAVAKSLSVSEVGRATPRVVVKPQAVTVKKTGAVTVKLRPSHQTLVRRFGRNTSEEADGSNNWSCAEKARLVNLENSVAASTGEKYSYWWNRFSVFCGREGRQEMPFSSMTAIVFLSGLVESADGLGGVDAARAALGFYFSLSYPELPSPTDSGEVKNVLRGIKRRFQSPVCKKAALNSENFYKILKAATDDANFLKVPLCKLRLAAQVSLMFCTFCRYEESAELRCSQVTKDKGDLLVKFAKGKTYQFGEARMSVVAGQTGPLDPVKVISIYMDKLRAVDKSLYGRLFPALRSTAAGDVVLDRPASYRSVLKQFKLVVVEAGVTDDPSSYGLHSMRRGAATSAVNNGASDHSVQKQMRVMSVSTVRRYASLDREALKAASTAVFKKQ